MTDQMFPPTEGERLRRVLQWLTAELEKAEKAEEAAGQKVVDCRARLDDCERAIKRLDEFGESFVDAEAVDERDLIEAEAGPDGEGEGDDLKATVAVDLETGEVERTEGEYDG